MADRMRKAADVADLSLGDVSQRLGVAQRTTSRWLSGETRPAMGQLIAWAQVTDVPVEWLLGQDERADVA